LNIVAMSTEKRLLITGGGGFLGRHLCRVASSTGYKVTSLALHPTPVEAPGVRHVFSDLADIDTLRSVLGDGEFDFVVNAGGYIDHRLFREGGRALIRAHFDGMLNLVECLNRDCLKRFVQIGSSDEYGGSPSPQREDMREKPISPYSLAKVSATRFLEMLRITENFPAVTLRLFLTYGPGQDNKRFLPQIIRGCLDDRRFPVSAGTQIRDFCYVDDIVMGILKSLTADNICGEIFNLGSGQPVSIRHMIERVQALIGKGKPEFGAIPMRTGENPALFADISKARRILGWEPVIPLDQGLLQTIDFFRTDHADD
jgi:nucleoside-diphosphate-sugar epimerase